MINLFIKPGIKNFFLLLGIWYLLITIYTLTSDPSSTNGELYLFYSKYSWPNFLLSYVLFIYIIPYYLDEKNYKKLIVAIFLTMCLFIFIRYLNNTYWQADYYLTWDRDLKPIKESPIAIIVGEFIRVFQFTLVPFGLRLYVEWRLKAEQRNRLEYEKVKAELSTLRYQLNPHFLLNAMNNIYFLSLVKSDLTPVAVMKLSELLRYTLYEKAEWVQLRKEIGHLKAMIDFHQIRFPDDEINLNIRVSETECSLLVPPLIFLTFIENAFKHGKPGTKSLPTKLSIFVSDDLLNYQVENLYYMNRESILVGGSGLENLKKRLDLMYLDKYSLHTGIHENAYFAKMKIPI